MKWIFLSKQNTAILSLKVPFMTIAAFAVSVHQDQSSQNVQSDLGSTLLWQNSVDKSKNESAIIWVIFLV